MFSYNNNYKNTIYPYPDIKMSLCKYKNIFGEINTGIHSIRIFNIAIFDTLSTILFAIVFYHIVIVNILNLSGTIKLWMVIVVMFLLGILLHRLFCVRTTIDKLLFKE